MRTEGVLPVPAPVRVVVASPTSSDSPLQALIEKIHACIAKISTSESDPQIVYLAIELAEYLRKASIDERRNLAEQAYQERDTVLCGLFVLCLGAAKGDEFHELLERVLAYPGEHPATDAAILSLAIPGFDSPEEGKLAVTFGSKERLRIGVFAEALDGVLEPLNHGFPTLKADLCAAGVLPDGLGNTYIPVTLSSSSDPIAVKILGRYRTKLATLSCGRMVASLLGDDSK